MELAKTLHLTVQKFNSLFDLFYQNGIKNSNDFHNRKNDNNAHDSVSFLNKSNLKSDKLNNNADGSSNDDTNNKKKSNVQFATSTTKANQGKKANTSHNILTIAMAYYNQHKKLYTGIFVHTILTSIIILLHTNRYISLLFVWIMFIVIVFIVTYVPQFTKSNNTDAFLGSATTTNNLQTNVLKSKKIN